MSNITRGLSKVKLCFTNFGSDILSYFVKITAIEMSHELSHERQFMSHEP